MPAMTGLWLQFEISSRILSGKQEASGGRESQKVKKKPVGVIMLLVHIILVRGGERLSYGQMLQGEIEKQRTLA